MANNLTTAFVHKFLPIIDDIYKMNSFTSGMDTPTLKNWFGGVNEIKVLKVSTTGLGNYTRNTGYPSGDITASWETFKLTQERAKELEMDRMDDEETLGLVFGTVVGNFMKEHVIPEIDAYRFAKYCAGAGHTKKGDLTKTDILQEIDEAIRYQDSQEVPREGRRLFINSDLRPVINAAVNRMWGSDASIQTGLDQYNGVPITYVTPGRFYSAITLKDGTGSNWGYEKDGTSGKDINFILMKQDGLIQGVKFALPKIFSPDINQEKDSWKFQYRNYHDVNILENKKAGIYAHTKN